MLPVATVVSCPSLHQWRPDNMVEEKKRVVRQLRTSTFRSYPRPSSGQPNQTKENIYSNTGSARSPLSPDVPDFSCAEKEPSFFYLSVRLPACLPAWRLNQMRASRGPAIHPSVTRLLLLRSIFISGPKDASAENLPFLAQFLPRPYQLCSYF